MFFPFAGVETRKYVYICILNKFTRTHPHTYHSRLTPSDPHTHTNQTGFNTTEKTARGLSKYAESARTRRAAPKTPSPASVQTHA